VHTPFFIHTIDQGVTQQSRILPLYVWSFLPILRIFFYPFCGYRTGFVWWFLSARNNIKIMLGVTQEFRKYVQYYIKNMLKILNISVPELICGFL